MLMTVNGLPVLLDMDDTLVVEQSICSRRELEVPGFARAVAVALRLNLRQGHGCLHCRDAVGQRFTAFVSKAYVKMIIDANRRRCLPPTLDVQQQCTGVFPGWPDDWPNLLGEAPFFAPAPGRIGRCA